MKRIFILILFLLTIIGCEEDTANDESQKIIGIYQGGGNWSDGTFAGYIFVTSAIVNTEDDHYTIVIEKEAIFSFPELKVEVYNIKDDVHYFNIMENPYYSEAHIADDDFNYFDLGGDPNEAFQEIELNLAISSLDPDSAYSLHFLGSRPL